MSGFQRGTSTINRKSGLKWGVLMLIFLPSLKVESVPSFGRHRERQFDNLNFENWQKIHKLRYGDKSKKVSSYTSHRKRMKNNRF